MVQHWYLHEDNDRTLASPLHLKKAYKVRGLANRSRYRESAQWRRYSSSKIRVR